MFPKIKISGTKFKDYKGKSVLEVPEGTIIQVMDCDQFSSHENIGDIVVRTDNDEAPFISLVGGPRHHYHERGKLWGPAINSHTFRVLIGKTIEDYSQ